MNQLYWEVKGEPDNTTHVLLWLQSYPDTVHLVDGHRSYGSVFRSPRGWKAVQYHTTSDSGYRAEVGLLTELPICTTQEEAQAVLITAVRLD